MFGIRTKNTLTLLLAMWLGFGSAVFAVDTCPESHACCNTAKKKSCCGETSVPAAPAPACQCTSELAQPLAGLKTVESVKRQSEKTDRNVDRPSPHGWSFKPLERIDRPFEISFNQGSTVALFRLTVRWRC